MVVVFFVIIIVLTFIGLITEPLSDVNNLVSALIIIFSLIAMVSVILSRKKSYHPY